MGKSRNSELRRTVKKFRSQKSYDENRKSSFWDWKTKVKEHFEEQSKIVEDAPKKEVPVKEDPNKERVKKRNPKKDKKVKFVVPVFEATTSLQRVMENKLKSAEFRSLNEYLYTHSSIDAFTYFNKKTDLFEAYHNGFSSTVKNWPLQPVDLVLKWLNSDSVPKNAVIGDFGCGDAKIARTVKQKVHSFDLIAMNEHVTACDMKKTPLPPVSLDVAVFCLSLMGTNWVEFLMEANRVLKKNGKLFIAEVESRITISSMFVTVLRKLGFQCVHDGTKSWKPRSMRKFHKKKQRKKEKSEVLYFGKEDTEMESYMDKLQGGDNYDDEIDLEKTPQEKELELLHEMDNMCKGYFVWFVFRKVSNEFDLKSIQNWRKQILKPCLYKKR